MLNPNLPLVKTRDRVIWFLIFFAGVIIRFHGLERQSLWDDEISTQDGINLHWNDFLHRFRTYETHPPLYFLQLRLWAALFGHSLGVLRANSAWWGSLSLIFFYAWVRYFFAPTTALLALALLAFSPFHLAYSQEMRSYTFALTLGVACFWFIERELRQPNIRPILWAGLTLIWTLELYTHYWGGFVVVAQALYAWQRFDRSMRQRLLVCLGLAGLAFAPWLPILAQQLHVINGLAFWVPKPGLTNVVRTFGAYTGLDFRFASGEFTSPLPHVLDCFLGLLYAVTFGIGWKRGPPPARWWLAIGLGLPFVISFWKPSLYVWYRYTFLIYPAFVVLCLSGLVNGMRYWRWIAALWLTAEGIGCWHYATDWQKANAKDVVAYVDSLASPQTLVIRPAYFATLFKIYDHGGRPVIDEDQLDTVGARAKLSGHPLIFIAFDVPSDPVGDALRQQFPEHSVRAFPGFADLGIRVYELGPPNVIDPSTAKVLR